MLFYTVIPWTADYFLYWLVTVGHIAVLLLGIISLVIHSAALYGLYGGKEEFLKPMIALYLVGFVTACLLSILTLALIVYVSFWTHTAKFVTQWKEKNKFALILLPLVMGCLAIMLVYFAIVVMSYINEQRELRKVASKIKAVMDDGDDGTTDSAGRQTIDLFRIKGSYD